MRLIGFNFTKISVEKKQTITTQPKLKTAINVLEMKELPGDVFKAKDIPIEAKFSYIIEYEPKIAELEFEGTLVILEDPKKAKEILKIWKDKELSEEFKSQVFNIILRKANIKAIQLEDELNLPIHFPLPSLKFEKK